MQVPSWCSLEPLTCDIIRDLWGLSGRTYLDEDSTYVRIQARPGKSRCKQPVDIAMRSKMHSKCSRKLELFHAGWSETRVLQDRSTEEKLHTAAEFTMAISATVLCVVPTADSASNSNQTLFMQGFYKPFYVLLGISHGSNHHISSICVLSPKFIAAIFSLRIAMMTEFEMDEEVQPSTDKGSASLISALVTSISIWW